MQIDTTFGGVSARDATGAPLNLRIVRDQTGVPEDGTKLSIPVAVVSSLLPEFEEAGIGGLLNPQLLAAEGEAVVVDLRVPELRTEPFDAAVRRLGAHVVPEEELRVCRSPAAIPNLLFALLVRIDGEEGWLQVDTGAGVTVLTHDSRLAHGLVLERGGEAIGIAGQRQDYQRAPDVSLSLGEHRAVIDAHVAESTGRGCGPDGLLGLDVLGRCALVMGQESVAVACGRLSGDACPPVVVDVPPSAAWKLIVPPTPEPTRRFMQRRAVCALILAILAVGAAPLEGQREYVVHRTPGDTIANSYRLHEPAGQPQGLLVLLPGYGSGVNGFAASSYTPSTLPARMAEQGILTIVAVPQAQTLYEEDGPLAVLDSIIAEVLSTYRISRNRIVVGGFSAGGTGAVRYAQICAEGRCQATSGLAGVFGVDPPLDFERLYRHESLIIRRDAPPATHAEAQMILDTFRSAFGGSPEQVPEAYRRHSPLLASLPDGGNARLLGTTPVRLYTEPDVEWWMENRNLDYHALNALDHAALINLLRVSGNRGAELITTTGQGYRPNGARHPHSWSIVDESDLAQWIIRVVCAADPAASE